VNRVTVKWIPHRHRENNGIASTWLVAFQTPTCLRRRRQPEAEACVSSLASIRQRTQRENSGALVYSECPFGLSVTPSITADADWPLNPLARRPRTSYPLYRIRSRIPAPRSQRSERVHHASPRRMWILVHAMYWLHASSARRSFLRGMRSEGVELLPLRHSGIPIYR
jgi:hypothetical protein